MLFGEPCDVGFDFSASCVKSPSCSADFGLSTSDGSHNMSFGGLAFFCMMLLNSAAGSRGEKPFGEVNFVDVCGDSP